MILYFAWFLLGAVLAKPDPYGEGGPPVPYNAPCHGVKDVSEDYLAAIDEFVVATYKEGTSLNGFHVLFAPHAMWTTLAAIAEGADFETQQQLFQLLNLPYDSCLRQEYYKLATSRIHSAADIHVSHKRYFVIDEDVAIKPNWLKFISKNSLLDVIAAPINSNPKVAIKDMRQIISGKLPTLNTNGNAVLLESIDFSGLWTTAFPDAVVEQAPFYSPKGEKLGTVDLMRMRRYVRMGYAPNLQAKVLQLPLGIDGRYYVIFALEWEGGNASQIIRSLKRSIVKEVRDCVEESAIPLDIAIPKFTMTLEVDAKSILEAIGVRDIWNNSSVTGFISEPPALPSSYIQRITLSLYPSGAYPAPFAPEPPSDAPTGLDPRAGRDFIANRPFLFGLFDTQSDTALVVSAFSRPTYS